MLLHGAGGVEPEFHYLIRRKLKMWTLIVIGLAFLGWYIMGPMGGAEAGEAAAPEPPPEPPAAEESAGGGSEFESAQAAPAEAEAPAEAPAAAGDDDPFKAPG